MQINEIIEGKRDLVEADFVGVEHLLTEQERQVRKDYMAASRFQDYWLKALQYSENASSEIHPNDEPILKHLYRLEASKSDDGSRLSVKFHFSDNEWFTNGCLLKEFAVDKDGDLLRTYGDAINWKEGKNVTVKSVKKKQKSKKTGEKKVSVKEVKEESFFHFFKAINLEDFEDDEEENEDEELAELQYQIALEIYDPMTVRSLEAYMGGPLGQGYFDQHSDEDYED